MEKQRGRIVGDVTYHEGDGTSMTIPPGHCEFTVTELDATLTWDDGDTRHRVRGRAGRASAGRLALDRPGDLPRATDTRCRRADHWLAQP